MANKILSIAIPTYNMERYLGRCLDSLVAARRTDALEIIVVNDGSTDCSSEIAHRYAKEHPNSIIVIDKKNGNYGSCVNAALKVATGKYFRVLDSDDWVDTDGLVQLLDKLKNAEADAVVTHFSKEFAATGKSEAHMIFVSGQASASACTRAVYSDLKYSSSINETPFSPRFTMRYSGFLRAMASVTGISVQVSG